MLSLQLPDGREVRCDPPPTAVCLAAIRAKTALELGREPRPRDLRLLWDWSLEQDRKYPVQSREE